MPSLVQFLALPCGAGLYSLPSPRRRRRLGHAVTIPHARLGGSAPRARRKRNRHGRGSSAALPAPAPPASISLWRLSPPDLGDGHRKVQDATYARFFNLVRSGDLDGFIMVYLGQEDDRLPARPPDLVSRDEVRDYPTDFAAMASSDIEKLSLRGEQLTHVMLDHYGHGL